MRRHGRLYDLNQGATYNEHGDHQRSADPTPETIQLMCSAIRLTWSEDERRNRDAMARFLVDYRNPVSFHPSIR